MSTVWSPPLSALSESGLLATSLTMPRSKEFYGDPIEEDTLYVALYERKAVGEAYHWALLLTGPGEAGRIHQTTDRTGSWAYEIREVEQVQPTRSMICLIGIGHIPPEKRAEAEEAMKSVHVPPQGGNLRSGEPFNCRTWLKLVISVLQREVILKLPLHVEDVETRCRIKAGTLLKPNDPEGKKLPRVTARIV